MGVITPAKKGGPVPSPYVAGDWRDVEGFRIAMVLTFDEGDRHLTQIDVHRDAECDFTTIVVGLGPDGTPNTSPIRWEPPVGDWTSSASDLAWLAGWGVTTIEQFLNLGQITAV